MAKQYKVTFSYRILHSGKKEIFTQLRDHPFVHANGYKNESIKNIKTALKQLAHRQIECKLEQKPQKKRNLFRRDHEQKRYKKRIKNIHVNNIITTRVTVICQNNTKRIRIVMQLRGIDPVWKWQI